MLPVTNQQAEAVILAPHDENSFFSTWLRKINSCGREFNFASPTKTSDERLKLLKNEFLSDGDQRSVRAIEAIEKIRSGALNTPVPNMYAAEFAISSVISQKLSTKRPWVFFPRADGLLYPFLISKIEPAVRDGSDFELQISLIATELKHANSASEARKHSASLVAEVQVTLTVTPSAIAGKTVEKTLNALGLVFPTDALMQEHAQQLNQLEVVCKDAVGKQFLSNGALLDCGGIATGRKSIADCGSVDVPVILDALWTKGCLDRVREVGWSHKGRGDVLPVPAHPLLRVFIPSMLGFGVVNASSLKLRKKRDDILNQLVIPPAVHVLMRALLEDVGVFSHDPISGKQSGAMVLVYGAPGTGKTLSAEIYAEVTGRPLITVRAGTMGSTAADVQRALKNIFGLALRWNCIVLINEADSLVFRREGNNLVRDAIVSEVLQETEYFPGTIFLTTNRIDHIDLAFLNRAAGLIEYTQPDAASLESIWKIMAEGHGVLKEIESFIPLLVEKTPYLSPREIKLLLPLAMRMNKGRPLDLQVLLDCASLRQIASQRIKAAHNSGLA